MSALEDFGAPRLDLPSTEDPMQLSPDMGRHASADDDIDIDFDIEGDVPDVGDDDNMDEQLDDIDDQQIYENREITAVNDDEMVDEGQSDQAHQEQASLLDEDLGDAEGLILDDTLGRPLLDQTLQADEGKEVEAYGEEPDKAQSRGVENSIEVQDFGDFAAGDQLDFNEPADEHNPDSGDQVRDTTDGQSSNSQKGDSELPSTLLPSTENIPDHMSEQSNRGASNQDNTEHLDSVTEERHAQPPETVTSIQIGLEDNDQLHDMSQGRKEDDLHPAVESLHPVIVVYEGNEMSLFPPIDQDAEQSQTYFLDNESYASESLSSLFRHCKSVLADSIRDDEELEIKVGELGLTINETSAEYTTTSLSQILEIFVQLNHNDGLESPGPLYIELRTNYKVSSRLDYLMAAVVEGKGLSKLEFLNDSENISGDDDYAQENEPVADDELDHTNSKANTAGENTFGVEDEDPGPDDSTSYKDEPQCSDEAIFKPADSIAANTAASSVANLPSEETVRQRLSNESPQEERFNSPQEFNGNRIRKHEPAVVDDDDDIIDYSDEEAAPERSSGSSTVRGDRQEEESGHPPKIGQLLDSKANSDLSQEHLPGMNSTGVSMDPSPQPQGLKADIEEVNGTADEEQGDPSYDPTDLVQADDPEDFADSEGHSENAIISGSIPDENIDTLEDDPASEVAAEVQKDIGKSVKSTANQIVVESAHRLPTSEIAFEDDLDYIYEDDTVHDPDITFSPTANDVENLRLHSSEANGHTYMAQVEDGLGKHLYQKPESSDQQTLVDDGDEITYDDDDEITIPDEENPVQKTTSNSPNLKRPRDDEHAPNGTSSDAKRVRST